MTRYLTAICAAVLLSGLAAYIALPSGGPGVLADHAMRPDDSRLVALGSTIYVENCASCHGALLEGQANWRARDADGRLPAPPHDETGHTWHHPDSYLFLLTKYGIETMIGRPYPNNMPAYEDDLSDEQIIAVLSYIKSRWPDSVRRRHDQINDRAAARQAKG